MARQLLEVVAQFRREQGEAYAIEPVKSQPVAGLVPSGNGHKVKMGV